MPVYVFKNSKKGVGPWPVQLENDREAELMAAGWADQGWSLDPKADASALLAEQSQAPAEPAKSTTTKEN